MNDFKEYLLSESFEIPIPFFEPETPVRLVIYDNKNKKFSLLNEVERGSKISGKFSDLSSHRDFKFKIQLNRSGRWVDEVRYQRLMGEKVSHEGLRYLFFPSDSARKLMVVFQAINRNPGYNYVGTLSSIDSHRLYIKDDYGNDVATRSSYYLGENRSLNIHHRVLNLIDSVREALGVRPENIIFCGSSKGGFAAIYTALSIGAGTVIAGGPQIMLGDFLDSKNPRSVNPPIMEFIAGDRSEHSVDWLNTLLPEKIFGCSGSVRIFIHVGKDEPHYLRHIVPFLGLVSAHPNLKINLDLGDYSKHSDLAEHFPVYLRSVAEQLTKERR